jgi:hypothetical protein
LKLRKIRFSKKESEERFNKDLFQKLEIFLFTSTIEDKLEEEKS